MGSPGLYNASARWVQEEYPDRLPVEHRRVKPTFRPEDGLRVRQGRRLIGAVAIRLTRKVDSFGAPFGRGVLLFHCAKAGRQDADQDWVGSRNLLATGIDKPQVVGKGGHEDASS
jgi:hypothetical protein